MTLPTATLSIEGCIDQGFGIELRMTARCSFCGEVEFAALDRDVYPGRDGLAFVRCIACGATMPLSRLHWAEDTEYHLIGEDA